jgi:ABC-type spermidine/putrescine transport system permease subunit I
MLFSLLLGFPSAYFARVSPQKFSMIITDIIIIKEPGSSGSIVSDYGLDDRAIGVRSPAGGKGFFL